VKNYSFCGSPEYMAPEMIKREGHTETLDFYCLGILLYEMVTGAAPFQNEDTETLFKQIVLTDIKFPSYLSKPLIDIIKALTEKDPELRLGAHGGCQEIKTHVWLEPVNFEVLASRKFSPPVTPKLFNGLPYEISFEPLDLKELIDDTPIDLAAGDEEAWKREFAIGSFTENVEENKNQEEKIESLPAGEVDVKIFGTSVNTMYDKFANFSYFIDKNEELETNLKEAECIFEENESECDHDEFLDEKPMPLEESHKFRGNILDEIETQKLN
jgi:serine/threonine protein kinase